MRRREARERRAKTRESEIGANLLVVLAVLGLDGDGMVRVRATVLSAQET